MQSFAAASESSAIDLFLDNCYDETKIPTPDDPLKISGTITTNECADSGTALNKNDYSFAVKEEVIGKTLSYQYGVLPSQRVYVDLDSFAGTYNNNYTSQHTYRYNYLKSSPEYPFNPQWFHTCRALEVIAQIPGNTIKIYNTLSSVKTLTTLSSLLKAKNVSEQTRLAFEHVFQQTKSLYELTKDSLKPSSDCSGARCTENGEWALLTAKDIKHVLIFEMLVTSELAYNRGKMISLDGAYKNGQSTLQNETIDFIPSLTAELQYFNLMSNAGTVDIDLAGKGLCNIKVIAGPDGRELSAKPNFDFTGLTVTVPGSYLETYDNFTIYLERNGEERLAAAQISVTDLTPEAKAEVNALYIDGCRFIPGGGSTSWNTCSVIGLCDDEESVLGACGVETSRDTATVSRSVSSDARDEYCQDTQWSYTGTANSTASMNGMNSYLEVSVSKTAQQGGMYCNGWWNNSSASAKIKEYIQIVKDGIDGRVPSEHDMINLHFDVSAATNVTQYNVSEVKLINKGVTLCEQKTDWTADEVEVTGEFTSSSCVATVSFDLRNIASIELDLQANAMADLGFSSSQASVRLNKITFMDGTTPESQGYRLIFMSQATP